jgi:Ca-activated chloride channel family protein
MTSRLLLSLSLLLAAQVGRAQPFAQPAEDFFHAGAQSYITNNLAKAREAVDQGLKQYPDDVKLKKLDALLKQQSQQQQSQQDQKDQQQPEPKDQQKQDQQKDQQQQKQDQQKQQESQSKPDQQKDAQQAQPKKDEEKKQEQAQAAAQKDKKDAQEKEGEENPPTEPGQMSPQQARQLLDAQKADENMMPLNPEEKPRDNSRPFKDW